MPPVWLAVKFSSQRCCQPGVAIVGEPLGVGRPVVAHVDRRRRALEDVELLARAWPGAGTHCTDVAPVPMIATRLSASWSIGAPVGVAAGVVVVPAAGVERVALEVLDAGDAGELRHVQRAGAHGDELRGELVAAVGADDPARAVVVPLEVGDLGVEQRVVVEAELLPDALAVLEDLRARARTSRSACARSPRAAACRRSSPCRTARRGSGSSTRCRRSRRPSR